MSNCDRHLEAGPRSCLARLPGISAGDFITKCSHLLTAAPGNPSPQILTVLSAALGWGGEAERHRPPPPIHQPPGCKPVAAGRKKEQNGAPTRPPPLRGGTRRTFWHPLIGSPIPSLLPRASPKSGRRRPPKKQRGSMLAEPLRAKTRARRGQEAGTAPPKSPPVGDSGRDPQGWPQGPCPRGDAAARGERRQGGSGEALGGRGGGEGWGGGIALPRGAWGEQRHRAGEPPSGGAAELGHRPSTLRAPVATARGEGSPGAAPRTCRAPASPHDPPPGEAACWVLGDVSLTSDRGEGERGPPDSFVVPPRGSQRRSPQPRGRAAVGGAREGGGPQGPCEPPARLEV